MAIFICRNRNATQRKATLHLNVKTVICSIVQLNFTLILVLSHPLSFLYFKRKYQNQLYKSLLVNSKLRVEVYNKAGVWRIELRIQVQK